MTPEAAFEFYKQTLEGLTRDSIDNLDAVCRVDVKFKDPLHDLNSRTEMKQAFLRLFQTTQDVRYFVEEYAVTEAVVYFRWRLTALLSGKPWEVNGVTQARFNAEGLVTEHVEYWDAASQLYEHFPIIGRLLRFLKHRIAGS
jgi:steroid delta-isomerase